jgi:hypothetical protein
MREPRSGRCNLGEQASVQSETRQAQEVGLRTQSLAWSALCEHQKPKVSPQEQLLVLVSRRVNPRIQITHVSSSGAEPSGKAAEYYMCV